MTYKDQDAEYYTDEEFGEELEAASESRFLAILGTSWGLSLVFHGFLLFMMTLVVFLAPRKEKHAKLAVKREIRMKVDETPKPKALFDTPKVEIPRPPVDKPIVPTEPVDVPSEKPKGIDKEALSDKTTTPTLNASDAMGVGGGGSTAFGDRSGKGRAANYGWSSASASSLRSALRWLRDHQSANGSWEAADWKHRCSKGRCSGPGTDEGQARFDVGVTALSLLAFLGDGQTHRSGNYKHTVSRGLHWLMKQQNGSGAIGFGEREDIYNHAIATMALCEAYAMTRDHKIKPKAKRALDFCLKAQNPGQGWRYGVKVGKNDTSVTGWFVLALKAARTAGFKVPSQAFDGALAFLRRATSSRGAAGYFKAGGGSSFIPKQRGMFDQLPTMTAVSLLCRLFAGEKRSTPVLKQGSALVAAAAPSWKSPSGHHSTINYYYWYYGTYAMFQVGGPRWKTWNKAMQSALISHQRTGGCEDGSWDGVGEWCVMGGRVYATAINALTLEIYYRYKRVKG